ncbi:MAG: sugar phosphate isomerase/epimerase [Anaerolineaceae bacterium]|nr:sugar phosphate isomerase/epimerase [Anaerolineaceae bacterium]
MANPFIAINCYTIRDACTNMKDFCESMEKLAKIGYSAVQISGVKNVTPLEIKQICQDNDLKICAAHIAMNLFEENFLREVDKLHLWECPAVALPVAPEKYRKNEAGWIQFAKDASSIGKQLTPKGITLCYHNHSFEFVRFGNGADSRNALDIIYDESEPEFLQGEIDTYWIQHGGGSPVAYINKLKGRQPIIHFKDMVIRDGQQTMTEVGEGNLDWPAIIKATIEAGVEALIVEQDICPGDPFESAQISYNNIASWGFK